ncbi:Major royal jelly-like protein [Penicillium expansum]|uniref:Major royal jelly-like protein n=1 Tax=Penicillium expansum TaxID=27334 RepID=A0A0A2J4D8_PENEN|nr:Major royal jelly-like protein [Penicillium expansum]KGO46497.1 Major royal jelly-like protein [Penicillium expansum]KGO50252.1 Major royal jelly-like protein [Penicillium expansum]KGO70102.1 Major royal jelly-like protein [Penicillium expansum]
MLCSTLLSLFSLALFAQGDVTKEHDDRLTTAVILETPTTGASTTPEGRAFLKLARVDGTTGSQIVEVIGEIGEQKLIPYPDDAWNSWNATTDSDVNSQNKYVSANSSKLISFNLTTNEVQRIYYLGDVTTEDGSLNDVRFNGKYAYFTEYTIGSLIVLDLETGFARMVLRGHRSVVALMPLSSDGQLVRTQSTGRFEYIHADQLEVSPDGRYFYYQPGIGYMWRIETKYLNEALHNDKAADLLPNYVEPFSLTPSTGGTAIDAKGNIYYSDGDRQEIRVIAPNGTTTLLVRDARLSWVDALWIDTQQRLWMCASQLGHSTRFVQPDNKTNTIVKPIYVYNIETGNNPSPIDHA